MLIKFVMESIHVYCLSLEHAPKSILEGIRKCCYAFLWSRKEKKGFHLANWGLVSKSKDLGGLGLKDIMILSKALASKIFWRCVQDLGL